MENQQPLFESKEAETTPSSGIPLERLVMLRGDCLEEMKKLGSNSVDLIVTDPFFGSSGRDGSVHLERDNILGNRMSSDSFIWFVRQYSKEFYRISKDYSHCYIFSDWRKYKDVQIAFETNFWELRQLIVWNKKNGMGEFWRSTYEFILFFTKRKPRKLTHGGCFNVIDDVKPIRGNKNHDYEEPIELIDKLIIASSNENEVVLDAFAGSFTTGVSCKRLKRKFIGIEVSEKNYQIGKQRIEAT